MRSSYTDCFLISVMYNIDDFELDSTLARYLWLEYPARGFQADRNRVLACTVSS